MADIPAPARRTTAPLQLIAGEPGGYCDPASGVCAVPPAANAAPTPEAPSPVKPDTAISHLNK